MRDIRLTELQGIHLLVIADDLHACHYLRSVLELWGRYRHCDQFR